MVQVRALSPLHGSGEIDLSEWVDQLLSTAVLARSHKEEILRACEVAQRVADADKGHHPALR